MTDGLRYQALALAVDACKDNDKVVSVAEKFFAFLSADAGATEKPATTRRKKADAEPTATTETVAETADAGNAGAASAETAPSTGAETPSKDDVIAAATKFGAAHGEAKLTPLIQKYGERISAIDPSNYAALIADLSGDPAPASVFD